MKKLSSLTSQQRKLAYGLGIIVLLAAVVYLSYPAAGVAGQSGASSGGLLFQKRADYELGEATLGNVDPTSATMNLVLLGLRGVATNVLWTQYLKQQKVHDWAGLRATANSIILLQPHFINVWIYQGWNLSYNVSAEWDAVEDRYYWVKEGIEFLKEGTSRNEKVPDLFWHVGQQLEQKIGGSDERDIFRPMFLADEEFNPDRKDNYLAAKDWYGQSVNVAERYERRPRSRSELVFRASGPMAQIQYAMALERDGIFDELARRAWQTGLRDWTQDLGQVRFPAQHGIEVKLEYTPAELDSLTEQHRYWSTRYQEILNYPYWRLRCQVEMDPEMLAVRRNVYDGDTAYTAGQLFEARSFYEEGLNLWEKIAERFPDFMNEGEVFYDGVETLFKYRDILIQLGEEELVEQMQEGRELPDDFPLKVVWDEYLRQRREARLQRQLAAQRRGGGGRGRGTGGGGGGGRNR